MTRANARLAVLVAALLAAPAAHAQLGIDLGGAPKEKPDKKDKAKKKKGEAKKKKPERHAPARPERHAPAIPETREEAPPAPAPEPEVRPPPAAETAPPAPPEPPERAPEPKPQRMPGLTLTPVDPKQAAAAKARLDAAKRLLDERATETAALAFDGIVRDRSLAPAHDEARFLRAKALARLGLGHSALAAFDEILERGPGATRFYQSSMEWLFYVGKGLKNEQPLMSRVVRYAGHGVPPAYEGRIDYLLAKYEFERGRALADAGRAQDARGAYAEARRLAEKVRPGGAAAALAGGEAKDGVPPGPDGGDSFARAKFVAGLVLFAQGDDQAAS